MGQHKSATLILGQHIKKNLLCDKEAGEEMINPWVNRIICLENTINLNFGSLRLLKFSDTFARIFKFVRKF